MSKNVSGSDKKLGAYECNAKKFKAKLKGTSANEVQSFDVKSAVPDLFAFSNKAPRILQSAVRQVLDDTFAKDNGFYYYRNSDKAFLHFKKMKPVAARAKLGIIKNALKLEIKKRLSGNAGTENKEEATVEKKSGAFGNETLAKMMTEGLSENPGIEEMSAWCTHVINNMFHDREQGRVPQELIDFNKSLPAGYWPLWNGMNSVICGNVVQLTNTPKKAKGGESIRQNFAVITAALLEIEDMTKRKAQGLMIVPLSVNLFLTKPATELYMHFFKNLPEYIRKNIILEINQLPMKNVPPHFLKHLQALATLCRGFMVNTSMLRRPDYDFRTFKPHAYGFDISMVGFSHEEVLSLLSKYSAHYAQNKIKTFVRDVSNIEFLNKAQKSGFTFISGSAVAPLSKNGVGARPLSIQQIQQRAQK